MFYNIHKLNKERKSNNRLYLVITRVRKCDPPSVTSSLTPPCHSTDWQCSSVFKFGHVWVSWELGTMTTTMRTDYHEDLLLWGLITMRTDFYEGWLLWGLNDPTLISISFTMRLPLNPLTQMIILVTMVS